MFSSGDSLSNRTRKVPWGLDEVREKAASLKQLLEAEAPHCWGPHDHVTNIAQNHTISNVFHNRDNLFASSKIGIDISKG